MRATDWLLLVFLSVLWGASFFFVAVAVREVPPLTLVVARVSLAFLILMPMAHVLGLKLPANVAQWRVFAIQALLNNVIPFSLIAYGQQHVTSGLASVLNATTPLFSLLVVRIFIREPLALHKMIGVGTGIAGVAILMGPTAIDADASSLIGMLCILGGALSYAFAALWMRRLRDTPPLVSATAQLIASTILLTPIAAVTDRFWQIPLPSTAAVAAIAGLALLSTALAYIVFFRINVTAGPTNVMLVTLLIPVTATALGALILREALAPNQILGALVIGSGLVIIDGRLLGRPAWLGTPRPDAGPRNTQ